MWLGERLSTRHDTLREVRFTLLSLPRAEVASWEAGSMSRYAGRQKPVTGAALPIVGCQGVGEGQYMNPGNGGMPGGRLSGKEI